MNELQDTSEDEENVITRARDFLRRGAKRLQEGTEDAAINFRKFWRSHFHARGENQDEEQIPTNAENDLIDGSDVSEAGKENQIRS